MINVSLCLTETPVAVIALSPGLFPLTVKRQGTAEMTVETGRTLALLPCLTSNSTAISSLEEARAPFSREANMLPTLCCFPPSPRWLFASSWLPPFFYASTFQHHPAPAPIP